jgi:NAD(P)-dependent dehydrogenase (short-subunit alcohol dehydrogenase family)
MAGTEGESRVCIITGGSSGVGLALALRFAERGYRIVTCGREAATLQQAHEKIAAAAPACVAVPLDLAEPQAAGRLIALARDHYGRLDVLINNAGFAPRAPLTEISADDFRQSIAVNVEAVFRCTKAAWPLLARQGGVIVNISSLASIDPFPGFSVYGACKAWVNLFTKAMADEGRSLGIGVFSIALGAVETRMLRGLFPDFPVSQTLTPEEVADVVLGLCAEPMRYATGQTLLVRK